MAIFDAILKEVDERFHLENKGAALLSALLGLMTDDQRGGLPGFLDMFRSVGLGRVADSWVAGGANAGLSVHQTTDSLGENTTKTLAKSAGLTPETATSALAFMIPSVVDSLTPNSVVPDNQSLRAAVGSYLSGAAANTPISTGGTAVQTAPDTGGAALGWLLPLVVLALLSVVGYQFCARPNQEVARANVTANSNLSRTATNSTTTNSNMLAIVIPAGQKIDSRISLKAENGKYFVSGVVPNEAARNQIEEEMRREFGAANVDFSGLKIDSNARPISWLAKFGELLPSLKGWTNGELTFEGENTLRAAGSIPQTAIDKIKALFTGWTLPAIFLGTGAEAQQAATQQAAKALETANTPQQVVDALNLDIINFATGSATIPAANEAVLQKAAQVLKTAPAGTTIEIGGHTDSQGNAASNQKLSDERANAVKNELAKLGVSAAVLTAKGFGQTKPKADNATENGRFQNRRIEYTLTSANGTAATVNENTKMTTAPHSETH